MLKLFFVVCLIVVVFPIPTLSWITTIVSIYKSIEAAINATSAPTPPPPLTPEQLERRFNQCVENADYGGKVMGDTVKVTEIKICNDLCIKSICTAFVFQTAPNPDGSHNCWLKQAVARDKRPGSGNFKAALISCTTDAMHCFYYGRYIIGGIIYVKTKTTKVGCYEFCLQKGSECKVFEYSFEAKECRTASVNYGKLRLETGWVSGFPRCDPGPIPTRPTPEELERLFNICPKVQDYNHRLLAVTRVKEMKVCHDLCPHTSKVFSSSSERFYCNFWIFTTTAEADGLHRCEFKATEPRYLIRGRINPNLRGALISCTTAVMRCFYYGRYIIGGTTYIKTETTKVGCYEFCLEKGSECKVFEYSFETKECKTASVNLGGRYEVYGWVSGFPSCDPGPVPAAPTQEQLEQLLNSCAKVQDYNQRLVDVTRVTEMKVCHDLCMHTSRVFSSSSERFYCNFWSFTTTADDDGLHLCELKATEPRFLKISWVDPNRRGALISCTSDVMRCFYYGRYVIGGTIYIKTETTKVGCYEFCLEKGSECKVFEYSFETKECRTAAMNLGGRYAVYGWLSGFPRCDPGPVPTAPTPEQLKRLINSCAKVQDYNHRLVAVTRVTEMKVCHDLCPLTSKVFLSERPAPFDCDFWIFKTTAEADGLHLCELKAIEPRFLISGRVDPNLRGALISCTTPVMRCFYYGRYVIGGFTDVKFATTKVGCYEFCLQKGRECVVFEYSFKFKECTTASINFGGRYVVKGWLSGFPNCDPGTIPTPHTREQLEQLLNSCAKVQDYSQRLVAVTRVTEMKVCHDLCPLTSKVFLSEGPDPIDCNFWSFKTIAEADGLHLCELKATEPRFLISSPVDSNRIGALISCTNDAMRCFYYGRYNFSGTIYIKTATTKVGCYEFCLEKGSECKVFEYNFSTKECKTASMNLGGRYAVTGWLSGFPRCDSIDTPTGSIDTPTGSIDTPTGSTTQP